MSVAANQYCGNPRTFRPIKEAAGHVGYSRDYVARLAREGKIAAQQDGRRWFVHLGSLEQFAADASVEREVRREYLRAERRVEREAQAAIAAANARAATRRQRAPRVAAAATSLVLAFGLGFATLVLHVPGSARVVHEYAPTPATTRLALGEVPRRDPVAATQATVEPQLPLTPHFATVREQQALTDTDGALVLGASHRAPLTLDDVPTLFSHPVTVARDSSGQWRVYRLGPDGKPRGDGVPFLMIPRAGAASPRE
jgi:excisionase family DNA binding protein